ncbi:sulfite exporter TauE/SafE family protein [Ornithinimicrobium pratense]|uniref:Probable membrane transporter protein n=1 Tax=Ornithinimicrobium pratense TaxID=2593973 RepID=A0A5J6V6P3_9MICO|nr:sulfite exporter TauE/SafE family protein [Ornithinimicrobium pratense]QFG68713.1 sulfite exporter TauE/SafE family protein [Ornithinimicrobium pratense]
MSVFEVVAIILAGLAAGTINTIVGSGTLVTFPTLLFFGYPPVAANVSNSLGLVPGGMAGAWGYRHELRSLGPMVRRLAPASLIGSVLGAVLLLVLPPAAFEAIVPILIFLSLLLVVFGPRLSRWAANQHADHLTPGRWVALILGILFAGMYGGYFGAAQGVLLIGVMSILLPLGIQQINGIKNVLGMIVNLVAAVVFLIVAPGVIDWTIVLLISIGSLMGGFLGARVGRAMHPNLLRAVIVIIGTVAIINLLVD